VLFDAKTIFCANAGDSRAVLYSKSPKSNQLECQALSEDHKPNLPAELERLKKQGARVEPIRGFKGEMLGPDRVWCKD